MLKDIIKPKNWICLYNYCLGLCNMISHKYLQAISYFNRCLKINPPMRITGLIYEQLGKCFFDIKELPKSKINLLKSIEMKKTSSKINSEISSRLGFIFYQEGSFSKAKYYLENALKAYNKNDYTNIDNVRECLEIVKDKQSS